MALSDGQQFFLQAFIANGILQAREVHDLYQKTADLFEDEVSNLGAFVKNINANIKQFLMCIKEATDEDDGTKSYVLVNSADDSISKLSQTFTENEMEFFKKMVLYFFAAVESKLSSMVYSDNGTISSIDAMNLSSTCEKLPKLRAEAFIRKLIEQKWLKRLSVGHYALSARAIAELDAFIIQHFHDEAVSCDICKRLVMMGNGCDECGSKVHKHCAKRYFSAGNNLVCPHPSCEAEWTHQTD